MKKTLFLFTFLTIHLFSGANHSRIDEIKQTLSDTFHLDKQFYLNKELFTLQMKDYQSMVEDINPFISSAKIALTNKALKDSPLNNFSQEELDLFNSYQELISLAFRINDNAAIIHLTHPIKDKDEIPYHGMESHRGYFLQILDLERSLNAPILEDTLLLTEIIQIQNILKLFKNVNHLYYMSNQSDSNLSFCKKGHTFKEVEFYWNSIVPIAEEMLYKLETQWTDISNNRLTILRLLFDKNYCLLIPCPDPNLNFIDRVLPYLLKYYDFSYVANRFATIYENHEKWERNFAWIELHVKGYHLLKNTDQEKAQKLLKDAKKLAKTTLTPPLFSSKKKEWESAKAAAWALIDSCD
jgi:hypothetical protein